MALFGSNRSTMRSSQRGFSMIEVLVTMLIVSLALLGTAGLQAYSMRLNQGGQFRTQAVFLAADLAERIEANRTAAVVDGAYVVASSNAAALPPSTKCLAADLPCNRTDLATFDFWQWQTAVAASLPQASWSVVRTPTGIPSTFTYTITISWVDRRADTSYSAVGTGETFSYVATRTVFN